MLLLFWLLISFFWFFCYLVLLDKGRIQVQLIKMLLQGSIKVTDEKYPFPIRLQDKQLENGQFICVERALKNGTYVLTAIPVARIERIVIDGEVRQ